MTSRCTHPCSQPAAQRGTRCGRRSRANADATTAAVVEMGRTWAAAHHQLAPARRPPFDEMSGGLNAIGVRPGDRVALLVPPGADLTAVLYATWRAGAVPVIADAGLGISGMRRALRGANVKHVIGSARGLERRKGHGAEGHIHLCRWIRAWHAPRAWGRLCAVEVLQIGRQVQPPPAHQ